jgi:hypothetical protein
MVKSRTKRSLSRSPSRLRPGGVNGFKVSRDAALRRVESGRRLNFPYPDDGLLKQARSDRSL